MVGAVGIENTTGRNSKDLEGMLGNAKALKRSNRECKGILVGPSFFSALRFRPRVFSHLLREASAQVKFHGTDGKLTRPVTYLEGCEGPIRTE
jgi:hypothetical protein